MANSMMQKLLSYVGLTDEGFEDDEYIETTPRRQPSRSAAPSRQRGFEEVEDDFEPEPERPSRTRSNERLAPVTPLGKLRNSRDPYTSGPTLVPPTQAATVRPIAPEPQPPLVINVEEFRDSKDVSEAFKSGRSVIVSLVDTPEEPRRRCIDFCSGVAHGLGGKMERISEGVFLMTHSTVSDEDRAKMKRQDLN